MNQYLVTGVFAGVFLMLFAFAEFLYHKLGVRAERTRKLVHICTGLITLLFPMFIANHWHVLFLAVSFLTILITSLKFSLLPSINAVERVTRGSLIYPLVIYACYWVASIYQNDTYFYLPILLLALCDPVAALVGMKWPLGKITIAGKCKSCSGTISFFLMAILVSGVGLYLSSSPMSIILMLALAAFTSVAEALTHKGYDNLTIPASALFVLICFQL